MRIVHIEAGRHLYGGAAQVRGLIDGLARAGCANLLVCARDAAIAARPLAATVVPLPIGGELDVAFLPRLVNVLRREQPDLVHVHSRRGADFFGGIAAGLAGVPAVLTRRVDQREPLWLGRLKYRRYAAVIALSRAIEAQLCAAGVDPARLVRIPSAVDVAERRPDGRARERLLEAFDLPSDALVIGVVAQLIARKRHSWLFAVLPEIVRRSPRVRVVCFGRGPLEACLRDEVAARDLSSNVHFAGFRDDLPRLLPGLDLLVHPADREGLGLALVEAAAAGVPVVACSAGGVPDIVEHERTGLLVPVGDPSALRDAIERLLAAPEERRRLGAAARSAALQRFSSDALVDRHLALYRALLTHGALPAAVAP